MVGLVMGLLSDFVLGGRFCCLWLVRWFLVVVLVVCFPGFGDFGRVAWVV